MDLTIPKDPCRDIIMSRIEYLKQHITYCQNDISESERGLKAAEQLLKIYDEAKSKEST